LTARRPAIPNSSRLSSLAQILLSNPLFAQTVASALQKGMETKGAIDRNLQTLLGLLNLPSRKDVRRLLSKLEVIQASLADLHQKVDRALGAEPARPARKPRARKPDAGRPGPG